MTPAVREATEPDVDALTALINAAYRVEDPLVHGDRIAQDEVRAKLATGVFLILDAPTAPDTPPAGAVYVEIAGECGYFGPMAVAPDRQGAGIGRALVRAAEDYCRARGCRHLDLDALDVRPELARFYSGLGFAPVGTAPFPRADRLKVPAHLIRMSKVLA